jgi:hypothetical protein
MKSGHGPIKGCRAVIIIKMIPFFVFRRSVASCNGGYGTAVEMCGVYVNSLEKFNIY